MIDLDGAELITIWKGGLGSCRVKLELKKNIDRKHDRTRWC